MDTLQTSLVGREVDGRYAVERRVAEGGMATVYLALDRRLDRRVALKVMHSDLAEDQEFVARFVQEARAAARLSHPNAVQVFDQGTDGEILYLAMEYLPGRTLRDALAERGTLSPREALAVLEPVLDALTAAHEAGIVHRDVKPENVLLTDDGRIKVADFGLAAAAAAPGVPGTDTGSGPLIGTVAYLAPELVSLGITDPRTDVYAVGIMLFEMLTGRQPFTAEDPVDVALQHVHSTVPAPSSLAPELPPELDAVVAAATARDAGERPADAAALLRLVRQVHAALPTGSLDVRAEPPYPLAGPAGGEATEVLAPNAPQPTRSLVVPGDKRLVERVRRADSGYDGTARDRRVPLVLGGLVVAALLAVGGLWWVFAGPGAYTDTPQVNGVAVAQAQQTLTEHGLRSSVTEAFSDTVARGTVISSKPGSGERVRKDGYVELTVSKGPQTVAVPEIVGKSRDDAQKALQALGLDFGDVAEDYDDAPAGQVLSVDPGVGETVKVGAKINAKVSKGPAPVDVPNVVGQTGDQAETALKAAGFTVKRTEDATTPSGPGLVTGQNPANGQAPKGSEVEIKVAPGNPLVTVPNVAGQSYDVANQILRAQGFQVYVTGPQLFGRVQSVEPGAGNTVPYGSTVTLNVF